MKIWLWQQNEFPTKDNLPLIPYHRESRRLEGLARLKSYHLEKPFGQNEKYYRTGIAVGDYPIDHHHTKNADAPEIEFIKIKVPSYNIPIGALIPKQGTPNFLVAEKSISVSNIVNGTTRLQPAVLGIGQASGALASYCIKNNITPSKANIRAVQEDLLKSKAYLLPYIDVNPADKDFETIQKIGATGIMKGVGIPYKWANQTWFYPEKTISEFDLVSGLNEFYPNILETQGSGADVSLEFLVKRIQKISKYAKPDSASVIDNNRASTVHDMKSLTRREVARIIEKHLNPFSVEIDFDGGKKEERGRKKEER